jgi:hypothetical protein
MRKLFGRIGNISTVTALVVAAIGGIFFGLFSCGGYSWHHELFMAIVVPVTLIAILAPGTILRSWQRRVIFPFALIITYVLFQAASAPFYPATPDSVTQYFKESLRTLEFGPC